MNIAVFVTIWSAGISSADLDEKFRGASLDFLKSNDAVQAVETYTPEPGDVPRMDDVPAPTIIIQIDVDDAAAAETLVQSDKFQQLFIDKGAYAAAVEKINLEILEPVHFPLPGLETPPPRTAPLSFVVRYYGPVKDASHFVDFYTSHHPPILSKFEGIRNVLCYLPLDWRTTKEVSDERLIIGNEVVFDDLDALKRALQSDVLEEAIADGASFPPFGHNSHHAMHRERIYSRQDE
jgi:hypothetical protein